MSQHINSLYSSLLYHRHVTAGDLHCPSCSVHHQPRTAPGRHYRLTFNLKTIAFFNNPTAASLLHADGRVAFGAGP